MPPVKLAVIGLGLMGSRHVEIIQSFDGCDLVGVCDLNPDLRAIADRHDIPFFQDIGEMLDHTKPDGAILATQSVEHVETFEACARRGVHALIEKPVAGTTEAALRIANSPTPRTHRCSSDTTVDTIRWSRRRTQSSKAEKSVTYWPSP